MADLDPTFTHNYQFGNIVKELPVDISGEDFEDKRGFFVRVETSGYLTYCPVENADSEAITRYFDASYIFNDPVLCRKIFKQEAVSPDTNADDVYIGYGV